MPTSRGLLRPAASATAARGRGGCSGCGGTPGPRSAATASTTPARASAGGTSPWIIANASRSWAPMPDLETRPRPSAPSTTRHTSRPRTSPVTTPCSTTGSAPAGGDRRRPARGAPGRAPARGDARRGDGVATVGARRTATTWIGSVNSPARRAITPAPPSAKTVQLGGTGAARPDDRRAEPAPARRVGDLGGGHAAPTRHRAGEAAPRRARSRSAPRRRRERRRPPLAPGRRSLTRFEQRDGG